MVGQIDYANHSLLPKRLPSHYLPEAGSDFWNECLKSIRTLNWFFAGLVPLVCNGDWEHVSSPCSVSPLLVAVNQSWWDQWTQKHYKSGLKKKKKQLVTKNLPANAGDMRHGFDSCIRKIPWRRAWWSTPLLLPGEFQEQRNLVGYSSKGCR